MLCKAVCCTVNWLIVWNIPISIPLDLNILGPYKFSLQTTVDRHGNLFTVAIILLLSIAVKKKHFYCNDDRITECNTIDTRNSSTVYILLYKLRVECFPDQTAEGGTPLTPMVPAHLSIPLIIGRGTCTKTCGIGRMFPLDDLWMVLILTQTVYWYMINF